MKRNHKKICIYRNSYYDMHGFPQKKSLYREYLIFNCRNLNFLNEKFFIYRHNFEIHQNQ